MKAKEIFQVIGLDIGRGYVKGWTIVDDKVVYCIFRSVYSLGRNTIDFTMYDEPILINYEGIDYFVGDIAVRENRNYISNQSDEKDTKTVEILIAAALSKLAVCDNVKIVLGVPYRNYLINTEQKNVAKYKGKEFKITDVLNQKTSVITVKDIILYREADAALLAAVEDHGLTGKPFGMITIGARTTELAYFNADMTFNDYMSDTIEFGSTTILKDLNDQLQAGGLIKNVVELDNEFYREKNKHLYAFGLERLNQILTGYWLNMSEMDIFIAGGTCEDFDLENTNYIKVQQPQLATAKGLYLVGCDTWQS